SKIRTCSRFELSAAKQRSRSRRRPEGRAKRVILHDPPVLKGALKALFCYSGISQFQFLTLMKYSALAA
ncbi:hypothetical protein MLU11_12805, partial [Escherichia coli]|nr:hypothetical protein [Escherichia coli]